MWERAEIVNNAISFIPRQFHIRIKLLLPIHYSFISVDAGKLRATTFEFSAVAIPKA